jgi:hypothetical protein
LAGLLVFSFHLRGRELPKPLILAHGGIATIGFIVLVFAFFAQ